jgi:hypothetical protein
MATKLQKDSLPLVTRSFFFVSNIDLVDGLERRGMGKKGGRMRGR